jgi:hypothetical protein
MEQLASATISAEHLATLGSRFKDIRDLDEIQARLISMIKAHFPPFPAAQPEDLFTTNEEFFNDAEEVFAGELIPAIEPPPDQPELQRKKQSEVAIQAQSHLQQQKQTAVAIPEQQSSAAASAIATTPGQFQL